MPRVVTLGSSSLDQCNFSFEVRVSQLAHLKKARASGRNVGKVFNPVLKLVFENYPFSISHLLFALRTLLSHRTL